MTLKSFKIKQDLKEGSPSSFTIADDGALYFKGRLVVPCKEKNLNMTQKVMKEAHDTPLSIYPGSTKMYQDIRQRFWWSNMKQDIARYVAECDVYRRIKSEHQRPIGTLQPISIPEWKWDHVEMDFINGFPKSQKGTMLFLSSLTGFLKLHTFWPSKKRSLLVSWQHSICPELFHFTVFRW